MNAVFVVRDNRYWLCFSCNREWRLTLDHKRATTFDSIKKAKSAIRARKRMWDKISPSLTQMLDENWRVVVRPVTKRLITISTEVLLKYTEAEDETL